MRGKSIGLISTEEMMLVASRIRNTGDAVFSNDVVINGQLDVKDLVALTGDIGTLNGLALTPSFVTSDAATVAWTAQAAPPATEDNAPANTPVESDTVDAGFSLRTIEQYQLEPGTFVWFEHRWQQYYRRSGVGEVWNEPDVTGPSNTQQLPYPGKSLWDGTQFRTISHDLFDLANGRSKGFEDLDVDDAEQSTAPTPATLAGSYLITKQGRD